MILQLSFFRDLEGKVQVIVNRCSHRGNLICIKREGIQMELTCVYHNWRYDLQGNLKSVAFGKGVVDDFNTDGTVRITGFSVFVSPYTKN